MKSETERKNIELIERLVQQSDAGNVPAAEEFYTNDYRDHAPSPIRATAGGIEGVRRAFEISRSGFADTKHEIKDIFADGDRVVARIYAEATHTGEMLGIAATGKRVVLEAIAIYRIESGKIAERWCYSGKGILDQLNETDDQ